MLGSRFDFSEAFHNKDVRPWNSEDKPAASSLGAPEQIDGGSDLLDLQCVVLEQEMMAVARTLHSTHPKVSFRCPVCDSRMEIRGEKALSEFGTLGVKLHELQCDTCGMLTGRVYHPSVGYHTLVR